MYRHLRHPRDLREKIEARRFRRFMFYVTI